MKKFTLLFVSIFALQALFSQPVLTNQINLTIGDTYKYNGYEGTTNIDPGPGGANQTWDFSNITGYGFFEGINAIAVDPSTTLFADSAVVQNANLCTRNMDDPNSGPYQYYDNTNSTSNLIAMGFLGITNSSFGTYIDVQTAFEFPFSYNDSFTDTYDFLAFHIENGYYFMRDSATVTVEADAYGTITTPLQEFQNVLRIKRTKTYYTWFRFEAGGDWLQSGPFTDIEYSWFAPNIKTPVMFVDVLEDIDDYPVRYIVEYDFTTGTEELADHHFEAFPNPATDRVTVKTNEVINSVGLYSIHGQLLYTNSQLGQSHQQTIELINYPKGVYIIKIGLEDGNFATKRFVKQ